MRKAHCFLLSCTLLIGIGLHAQTSFPVNGVADERSGYYVFTNATIVKDAATSISSATMVIRDGKIVAVGKDIKIPQDAVAIDCKGRYIYPSFIDIYSDYGMPAQQTT